MCVYNGQRYIREALDSIFAQNYRPIEVIVVDDGSTDETAAIAQSYTEVRYIYQTNQGVATARNAGVRAARGEFLAFLDADDVWAPNKLERQVEYLRRHPHVGYVIAKMRPFLEPGTNRPPWVPETYLSTDIPAYSACALLVRKSVFEDVGFFDTSYRYSDDSDWFFQANDAGIPMAILPETLLYRRIHDANITNSNTKTMSSEMLRVLRASIQRKRRQHP